jgi:hypothetical protein
MKSSGMIFIFLLLLAVFNTACQKVEDLFSNKKSSSNDSQKVSTGKSSLIATRKDASVEIKLSFSNLYPFKEETTNSAYPDYYEVYISKNEGIDWDLVKTVDTSFINKSFTISGLTNEVLYFIYLKEVKNKVGVSNTNVVRFVPSSFKPTYKFVLDDYYGQDLYSFAVSRNLGKTVYATKFYEYQQNYAAPAIFLSNPNRFPQLIDINCWFPDLSGDGTNISYSSNKGEVFDGHLIPEHIAIFNFNTNKSTRITSGYSVNKYPAWSPTNSSLVYSSSEKSDQGLRIKLFNTETSKSQILETNPNLNQDILSYSQERSAWSPDGKYIYYTHIYFTNDNVNPGYYDIYRINSTGGTPEPIFTSKRIECCPSISPDNSKLAFLTDYNGKVQIWIYSFLDSKFHQPFDSNSYELSETWSRIKWIDNKTILFSGYSGERGGDESLFSITVE